MIELRDVTVEVPDGDARRRLLDRASLNAGPGEVVVVTGASGSGKSTLLAVAGLLRRPLAGEVELDGIAAADLSERRRTTLRRDRVGIVYQSANLVPTLTAREQLELVAHIGNRPRREARRRAETLLADLGLSAHAERLPSRLSGGERQRVGLARALMAEPSVLLADEPTASLDPELAAQVARLMADQARLRGLATVVVTHDPAPLAHADRHLHLVGGALVRP